MYYNNCYKLLGGMQICYILLRGMRRSILRAVLTGRVWTFACEQV